MAIRSASSASNDVFLAWLFFTIEGSSNRGGSVDARTFFTLWDSPPKVHNDGQIPLSHGNPNHHQDHHITQNHLIKLILFFFLLLVGEVKPTPEQHAKCTLC
jgi:hypothetical protein